MKKSSGGRSNAPPLDVTQPDQEPGLNRHLYQNNSTKYASCPQCDLKMLKKSLKKHLAKSCKHGPQRREEELMLDDESDIRIVEETDGAIDAGNGDLLGDLVEEEVAQKRKSCLVCGDSYGSSKYGVPACFACHKFFERRHKARLACFAGNNCVIDIETRNQCPHCRLHKCLRLGMKMMQQPQNHDGNSDHLNSITRKSNSENELDEDLWVFDASDATVVGDIEESEKNENRTIARKRNLTNVDNGSHLEEEAQKQPSKKLKAARSVPAHEEDMDTVRAQLPHSSNKNPSGLLAEVKQQRHDQGLAEFNGLREFSMGHFELEEDLKPEDVQLENLPAQNENFAPHAPGQDQPAGQQYLGWNSEQVLGWAKSFINNPSYMDFLCKREFTGLAIRKICTSDDWIKLNMPYSLYAELEYNFHRLP